MVRRNYKFRFNLLSYSLDSNNGSNQRRCAEIIPAIVQDSEGTNVVAVLDEAEGNHFIQTKQSGATLESWPMEIKNMRKLIIIIVMIIATGCIENPRLQEVIIIEVYHQDETGVPDWVTVVEKENGERVCIYGKRGKVGDKFKCKL